MSDLLLARRERHALCDLALELGPEAPTLCEGWAVADLVAHCLVRETDPVAALGAVVPPLAGLADRAVARARRRPLPQLVARLRDPGLTPYRLRPVERVANTLEFLIHHEDVRRAQPGWQPRALAPADAAVVWGSLGGLGRLLVRPAGVPVQVRDADSGRRTTLRAGADPVVVTGAPVELALLLSGRDQVRGVTVDGPPDRVAAFRAAGFDC